MKKIKILLMALSGVLLMTTACRKENPGLLTTEIRTLDSFSSIEVEDAINVYVTQGDVKEVKVETNSSYLAHVFTNVNGSVLKISVDKKSFMLLPQRHHDINIYITVKSLTGINASGASEVSCSGSIEAESFNVNLSGASKFSCSSLNTNTTTIDGSGASEIKMTGSTNTLIVSSLSGASELNALNFISDTANLELSGASEATINVTTDLNVKASGASEVKYKGDPINIIQDLSGASQLIKL
jgi:hypothetical protein